MVMDNRSSIYCALIAAFVYCISSCSKMNSTYVDFIKTGEIVYSGKIDSLNAFPGRNRIRLTWLLPPDPNVASAKIFWNNKADSLVLTFPPPPRERRVDQMIDSLSDGSYTFEIYTYDSLGNSSIEADTLITAYGDLYQSTLLGRPVQEAGLSNDTASIVWYGPAKGAIGELITYEDVDGDSVTVFSPVGDDTTLLYNYQRTTSFVYSTLYMPEPTCLDTFSTAPDMHKVRGLPVDLDKSGWTATASSFDTRTGKSYRPPSNAIDNDPSTIWVNEISPVQTDYPHTITVDMGQVQPDIDGFSFIQRTPLDGALKDLEIQISTDSLTWTSLGNFELANVGNEQFIDLMQPETFRYFRIIGKDDYKSSKNISLAEVGVFTR